MKTRFMINGVPVEAQFDDASVQTVLQPMVESILKTAQIVQGRTIVFLAAPPAAGKSTLAAFFEVLAEEMGIAGFQAVGMDGFHYPQQYIAAHTVIRDGKEIPMQCVKGAPDSFDAVKLRATLEKLRTEDVSWPGYDRTLHDVVENQRMITGDIVLVEGNYLLLDRDIWRDLPHDFSIFVAAEEHQLRERLLTRKMRSGATEEAALAHYESSDGPNVRLTLAERLPADVTLRMLGDGQFTVV